MYFQNYGIIDGVWYLKKKLTENGGNDGKPKFVENFRFFLFYFLIKRRKWTKISVHIFAGAAGLPKYSIYGNFCQLQPISFSYSPPALLAPMKNQRQYRKFSTNHESKQYLVLKIIAFCFSFWKRKNILLNLINKSKFFWE